MILVDMSANKATLYQVHHIKWQSHRVLRLQSNPHVCRKGFSEPFLSSIADVNHLLNCIVSPKGNVLIPNVRDGTLPVTLKIRIQRRFGLVSYKKAKKRFSLLHKVETKRLMMYRICFLF